MNGQLLLRRVVSLPRFLQQQRRQSRLFFWGVITKGGGGGGGGKWSVVLGAAQGFRTRIKSQEERERLSSTSTTYYIRTATPPNVDCDNNKEVPHCCMYLVVLVLCV